ncbi:MAG: dihydropteroate synthase [Bacteroidetes bacterium MedPE-SWsnd-G2]|nr:MAG: dihydropteroate synthase [Bacteroidetes bacterium MedPE-SWsnd-G2]
MGILNLTPDSFYDGGTLKSETQILTKVEQMLKDGATFIDVGGYSSRPNATHIEMSEELNRVLPIVKLLLAEFPDILISVDTFRSEVADQCLKAGAAVINDISAGNMDNNMFQVIRNHQVPYIMMHMVGTPQNMQSQTTYKNLTQDINLYFSERVEKARALGIVDLIIDPGFGFSKTTAQNFKLLNQLDDLKLLDLPILAGLSRKSMIYKTLEIEAKDALNGTTALNMIALQKGSKILRVHDVKEASECITLFNQLQNN